MTNPAIPQSASVVSVASSNLPQAGPAAALRSILWRWNGSSLPNRVPDHQRSGASGSMVKRPVWIFHGAVLRAVKWNGVSNTDALQIGRPPCLRRRWSRPENEMRVNFSDCGFPIGCCRHKASYRPSCCRASISRLCRSCECRQPAGPGFLRRTSRPSWTVPHSVDRVRRGDARHT